MAEELITVIDAARILKVRQETIRRYIKDGHLSAVTLPGGDYRLRMIDLQNMLRKTDQNGDK